ncbi:hypothetical protein BB560_002981 [Smittium megazygosporum]|uniref:CSC1/OSCA1-like 7TM region domain-containing protein n=1 Tax=Smittium megazygosporum TaxID=133381 RepID=A0A2T9ZDC7_9FUNG|nr:hypothetical protein BB560_002981 [Smittium megazygosporum]
MNFTFLLPLKTPKNIDPPFPGTTPYLAQNFKDLGTQTLFSLFLGSIAFLTFCSLRSFSPSFYAPRSRLKRGAPALLPKGFFAWIPTVWNASEKDILRSVGLDAIHSSKLTPINDLPKFWKAFLSSSLGSNNVLLVHLLFSYFFTGLVYLFTTHFSYQIAYLRWNYLLYLKLSVPVRTVVVSEIPLHLRNPADLKSYFEAAGIGSVQSCTILPSIKNLNLIVERRVNVLTIIEQRYAKLLGNPADAPSYNPNLLLNCFYDRTNSSFETEVQYLLSWAKPKYRNPEYINAWVSKTHVLRDRFFHLDDKISFERSLYHNKISSPSSVGFVTFHSAKSAQTASQLSIYTNPTKLKVHTAPEPRGILWQNINTSLNSKVLYSALISVPILLLLIFWLVPITFLSSLASPEFINSYFPGFLDFLKKNPILNTFFRFTIPSLILSAFNEVVPYFLNYLSFFSGVSSISEQQSDTIVQYFKFLIVSVLLIFTISKVVLSSIFEWIENPSKIPKLLADVLPGVAPFFMGYIALLGIGYYPIRLTRIGALISITIKRLFCKSPRDYASCFGPEYTRWEFLYPPSMLIFTISMTYSSIAPMISVFAVIYFFVAYFISKYMILYVYSPSFESAGYYTYRIIKNMIGGLLVQLLLTLGIFGLRKNVTFFICQLVLVLINLYVMSNVSLYFDYGQKFIPLDMFNKSRSAQFLPYSHREYNSPSFQHNHKGKKNLEEINANNASTPLLNSKLGNFGQANQHDLQSYDFTSNPSSSQNHTSFPGGKSYLNSKVTCGHDSNGGNNGNPSIPHHKQTIVPTSSGGNPVNNAPPNSKKSRIYSDNFNRNESGTSNAATLGLNPGESSFETQNNFEDFANKGVQDTDAIRYSIRGSIHSNVDDDIYNEASSENRVASLIRSLKDRVEYAIQRFSDALKYTFIDQYLSLDLFAINRESIYNPRYRYGSTNSTLRFSEVLQPTEERGVGFGKILETRDPNLSLKNTANAANTANGEFCEDGIHPVDQSSGSSSHEIDVESLGFVSPKPNDFVPERASGNERGLRLLTELRWFGSGTEYGLLPTKHSDYSQPGMTKQFGVLDGSNMPYMYPVLSGSLPYLWLPSRKIQPL